MLPFMVAVKNPQYLPEHLPGAFGLSVRSEAIAELPRAVVKRCVRPGKRLDTSITQDHEVGLMQGRLPTCRQVRWLIGGGMI